MQQHGYRPNRGVGAGKGDNLYTAMHAAMRPNGAQQVQDVTVRAIEQGGKLVACPALGLRAVFQMPRGNLEGVCPRVLVLAGIAASLQVRHLSMNKQMLSQVKLHIPLWDVFSQAHYISWLRNLNHTQTSKACNAAATNM